MDDGRASRLPRRVQHRAERGRGRDRPLPPSHVREGDRAQDLGLDGLDDARGVGRGAQPPPPLPARRKSRPRSRRAQHETAALGQPPDDRALRPSRRPRAHLEVVLLRPQHDERDVPTQGTRGAEGWRGFREPVQDGRAPEHGRHGHRRRLQARRHGGARRDGEVLRAVRVVSVRRVARVGLRRRRRAARDRRPPDVHPRGRDHQRALVHHHRDEPRRGRHLPVRDGDEAAVG
mmetsp:Transcript_10878/g.39378  ORF Transcript_10878/g.39378 Transcript_10878/m.39378 type:complete len:233 (-) Transcript_10878:631-1329(-)